LHANLKRIVGLLNELEPNRFSEQQFAEVEAVLSELIDALEHYILGLHSSERALHQSYGRFVREIREAKRWIAEGHSPDPARRPSEQELRERAANHAAVTLRDLLT